MDYVQDDSQQIFLNTENDGSKNTNGEDDHSLIVTNSLEVIFARSVSGNNDDGGVIKLSAVEGNEEFFDKCGTWQHYVYQVSSDTKKDINTKMSDRNNAGSDMECDSSDHHSKFLESCNTETEKNTKSREQNGDTLSAKHFLDIFDEDSICGKDDNGGVIVQSTSEKLYYFVTLGHGYKQMSSNVKNKQNIKKRELNVIGGDMECDPLDHPKSSESSNTESESNTKSSEQSGDTFIANHLPNIIDEGGVSVKDDGTVVIRMVISEDEMIETHSPLGSDMETGSLELSPKTSDSSYTEREEYTKTKKQNESTVSVKHSPEIISENSFSDKDYYVMLSSSEDEEEFCDNCSLSERISVESFGVQIPTVSSEKGNMMSLLKNVFDEENHDSEDIETQANVYEEIVQVIENIVSAEWRLLDELRAMHFLLKELNIAICNKKQLEM